MDKLRGRTNAQKLRFVPGQSIFSQDLLLSQRNRELRPINPSGKAPGQTDSLQIGSVFNGTEAAPLVSSPDSSAST